MEQPKSLPYEQAQRRPPCAVCKRPMRLAGVKPISSEKDLCTFVCNPCERDETYVVTYE